MAISSSTRAPLLAARLTALTVLALTALALPTRAQVLQWADPYVSSGPSAGTTVAADRAGNVYVGGSQSVGSAKAYLVIKYSPSGSILWFQSFSGGGSADTVFGLAVDDVGGVYVTGRAGADCVTIKYSAASGVQQWMVNSPGAEGRALALGNDGSLYVLAATTPQATSDFRTLKYDAASGVQLASALFSGAGNGPDYPFAMTVDGRGNVIVVGSAYQGGGFDQDYVTLKYSPSLSLAWTAYYDAAGNPFPIDQAFAVAVDQANDVYVTGMSYGGTATGHDYATVKYSGINGAQMWVTRYDGGAGNDLATAIAVDSRCNRVFVTGAASDSGGGGDYVTIRLSASTGAQSWLKKYQDAINNNEAKAIVLDHAGDVYVTGKSDWDFVTIKYRGANGLQSWLARYNGTGNHEDGAGAMAIDAQGCVIVTGSSRDTSILDRCTTVKYCRGCTNGRAAL